MAAIFVLLLSVLVAMTTVSGQYNYAPAPPPSRVRVFEPHPSNRRPQGGYASGYPITSYPAPPRGFHAGLPPQQQVRRTYVPQFRVPPIGRRERSDSARALAGAVVHELIGTGIDVARGLAQPDVAGTASIFLNRGQRLVNRLGGGGGGGSLLDLLARAGMNSLLGRSNAGRLVGDFFTNGLNVDIGRFTEK